MLEYGLVLKQGELFLASRIETKWSGEDAAGLYFRDTRFLSLFDVKLNGAPLELLEVHASDMTHASVVLTNEPVHGDEAHLPPRQIALEAAIVLDTSLVIGLTLQNFSDQAHDLSVELDLANDFRDLFDIRGFDRERRGEALPADVGDHSCVLSYRGLDRQILRTLINVDRDVSIEPFSQGPTREGGVGLTGARLRMPFRLDAGAHATATLTVSVESAGASPLAMEQVETGARTSVRTGRALLDRALEQCERDLIALDTPFPQGVMPAAGIPWFVAPFGRDSLIVGLQTLHLRPESAIGTLRVLASLQGTKEDPETEEEPGKILHEMRYGEMARNREIPHRPYYGTNDATPLFAWLIAEVIGWTADPALYAELVPHARRAFDWIEQYGDVDGDGLIEYTTVRHGDSYITHKVWKDSHDSLHYPDGRPAAGLIAAVEVQGYAYAAYARMAEMAELFGDPEWAGELREKAGQIRDLVETRFWLETDHCYVQALDGDKQPIGALTSNAGHLLASGLPARERAMLLAERFMEPDFASGWGIRTLSSRMASYNPMSYHNGSIWPHDNSFVGAGFYRYGFDAAGGMVLDALLGAAAAEPDFRLPELYCGFPRRNERNDRPVSYPVSCSPQAWAAGALPLLTRSMLGLEASTEHRILTISPRLPDWLEEVEITGLRAFGETGSIRVSRIEGGYEVDATGLNTKLLLP